METNIGTTMGQVSRIVEDFTVDLHKNLANRIQGNFVSSALSAHIVLSMAAYGAGGNTAQEMRSILRLPHNHEENFQEFHDLIYNLNNIPNVTLKLVDKIYASNKLEVKDTFKKFTNTYFDSDSETMDFSKAQSFKIINKWFSEKTNGKIKRMVRRNELSTDTMMILLNAIYFKGNWKYKFMKENTKVSPFHVNDKITVDVPMMNIKKKLIYKNLKNIHATCISLPYENEDLSMIIVVPKKIDGLKNVEKYLETISIDYKNDFEIYKADVNLTLPKFKVETSINLKSYLQEMGMIDLFTEFANFSGISDLPLQVDKVRQKAIIEVDEEGSEAAAITDIVMMARMAPLIYSVNVNKPFFYKILYKNITLFSGRINNPLAIK